MITKRIDQLKKGDIVLYYGAEFQVTEDSKELDHRKGVYFAPCKYVRGGSNTVIDVLKQFDGFQGNTKVAHQVINAKTL